MSRVRHPSIIDVPFASAKDVDLNEQQLTSYLSDLLAVGKHVSIRVKDSAQASYRSVRRLSELHVHVLNKRIWGAELVYECDGHQCVDTLEVGPGCTHLRRRSVPVDLTA